MTEDRVVDASTTQILGWSAWARNKRDGPRKVIAWPKKRSDSYKETGEIRRSNDNNRSTTGE